MDTTKPDTVELFKVMLGITSMLGESVDEMVDFLKVVLETMKVGQPHPVVMTKIQMTRVEWDSIKANTPWRNWKD